MLHARFVLDASVAMRWALADGSAADLKYADQVLGGSALALVSRNGPRLACASRRGLRSEERCIAAHLRIKGPPIAMDEAAPSFTQAGVARSGFAQGF
jgi:hypothetical protein